MMRKYCAVGLLLANVQAFADNVQWGVDLQQQYMVAPNVTYLVADGYEAKLDVIFRQDRVAAPTLLLIHGGGWVGLEKGHVALHYLPYLALGFAIVNVDYRLARDALAPAAVEDARCALRWLIENARTYGFDTDKIVVSGHSAGGHLSLTTGMLPASAGLDRRCPVRNPAAGITDSHEPEMPVAAIVNWFGITDVADLVEGPNAKTYAVTWMGAQADWKAIARRVSPLEYVRAGLPPILTIHGNADPIVPYDHAVRLHKALDREGVTHSLHTIEGGGHGDFSPAQNQEAMATIRKFLEDAGI